MALSPDARRCLKYALPHLAWVIAAMRALIGTHTRLPLAIRPKVLALLRPAEALARRLLILLAKDISPDTRGSRPFPEDLKGRRAEPVEGQGPATPRFHLSEPLVTFAVLMARQRTPVRLLHWHIPAPAAQSADKPDRILTRLAALDTLVSHPKGAARRMARWLARHEARPGRRSPLRIGYPPGCSPHPPDERLDCLLRDAQMFAQTALDPPPG